MNNEQALATVNALAAGINPLSGEHFPPDSPYNHPLVIRSLFWLLQNSANPLPAAKKSPEDKQQANLNAGLPINHGLPWQEAQVVQAIEQFKTNTPISVIASQLGRKSTSVVSLLFKHELISEQQAQSLGLRYLPNA